MPTSWDSDCPTADKRIPALSPPFDVKTPKRTLAGTCLPLSCAPHLIHSENNIAGISFFFCGRFLGLTRGFLWTGHLTAVIEVPGNLDLGVCRGTLAATPRASKSPTHLRSVRRSGALLLQALAERLVELQQRSLRRSISSRLPQGPPCSKAFARCSN